MIRTLATVTALSVAALLPLSPLAWAGEQPNVLIMGEDADLDTVPRNSRIFDRVLRAIPGELEAEGFRVYDETAVTMEITNPDRVRRDDAELITVAKRVQGVPIDVVTAFEIYATAEKSAYADITDLRMRIAGRMLNVQTGRSLGNYEVSYRPGDLPPLPANCNRECVLEHVGDQAARVGADVGAVLAAKLDKVSPAEGATGPDISVTGTGATEVATVTPEVCTGMTTAYTLTFKGFEPTELTLVEEYLVAFKGYDHHRPVRTDAGQSDYWYETCSDEARLNRNLRLMAEHMGLEARVAKTGNRFDVLKIGAVPGR